MNCYLRWLKKTSEFCFATQLFTTVLKSKLSDMEHFPPSLQKKKRKKKRLWISNDDQTAQHGVVTFRESENCAYWSLQFTQRRRVVLNLITVLRNKWPDAPVTQASICLFSSMLWLFGFIFQEDKKADLFPWWEDLISNALFLFPPSGSRVQVEKHFVRLPYEICPFVLFLLSITEYTV